MSFIPELSIFYEHKCIDFHWLDMIKYVDQSIFCQIYQLLIFHKLPNTNK